MEREKPVTPLQFQPRMQEMNPEAPIAFDSLDERARSVASGDPLDRISLRDHVVEVEIGAFQAERGNVQRVAFDVVVEVAKTASALDDDVDRILSYDTITQAISDELAAERLNLLETLAGRIGERILSEPLAHKVFVRIQKLDRGPGALGVEIVRSKDTGEHIEITDENRPEPWVFFLSSDAVRSENLTKMIDELASLQVPAVICVAAPDEATPKSDVAMAQRRIDLLAIEQNAWVLAGRDRRCVVVGTRTELDWAARNGQLSVWAPSKIVLDGVDGPTGEIGDGTSISVWFAMQIGASGIVFVGTDAPENCPLPARSVPIGAAFIA